MNFAGLLYTMSVVKIQDVKLLDAKLDAFIKNFDSTDEKLVSTGFKIDRYSFWWGSTKDQMTKATTYADNGDICSFICNMHYFYIPNMGRAIPVQCAEFIGDIRDWLDIYLASPADKRNRIVEWYNMMCDTRPCQHL